MATEYKLNYTATQVNEKLGQIENKVDKIEGKGLSTNDFTSEEKEKLESLNNSNILNGAAKGSLRTSMSSVENDEYKLGIGAFTEGSST